MSDKKEKPVAAKKKSLAKEKTIYTHGKKFVVPIDTDLEQWLKEKYPEEYK